MASKDRHWLSSYFIGFPRPGNGDSINVGGYCIWRIKSGTSSWLPGKGSFKNSDISYMNINSITIVQLYDQRWKR